MRNTIDSRGFVSDLFNSPDNLKVEVKSSISGGFVVNGKKVIPDNIVFVESLSDFPSPANGVITLETSRSYIVTQEVNLQNNRIVLSQNASILGLNFKSSKLTTNVENQPMLSGSVGTKVEKLTLQANGLNSTIMDIGGNTNDINDITVFSEVLFLKSAVGKISSTKRAEILFSTFNSCSTGITFNGEYEKIIFDTVDVQNSQPGFALSSLESGSVVQDRFLMTNCRIHIDSGQIGISSSINATIPNDGYQLFMNHFLGDGDFIKGIGPDSDKSLFENNIGIFDSLATATMQLKNNNDVTILTQDVWKKVSGSTTLSGEIVSEKFTHSANRLTYFGNKIRKFQILSIVSVASNPNVNFEIAIFKNESLLSGTDFPITTNGNGRFANVATAGTTLMRNGDFVEMFIRNITNNVSGTVETMNFNITEL